MKEHQQQTNAGAGVARRGASIQSEAEYTAALAEVEPLMGAKERTPEYDRLDVLATRIQEYERIHHPIETPTPEAMAEYEREKRGGWIPVGERLPESGVRVLVAGRALCGLVLVLAMRYIGGAGERYWYDGPNLVAIGNNVEYWQPIPSPPPI